MYKICKHVNGVEEEYYTVSRCWYFGLFSTTYKEFDFRACGCITVRFKSYARALKKVEELKRDDLKYNYKLVSCEVIK